MEPAQEHLQAIADIGSKMTYSGSGIAVLLGWLNQYAGAFGLVIAFIGVCINGYYRRKAYKLLEGKVNNKIIPTKSDLDDDYP